MNRFNATDQGIDYNPVFSIEYYKAANSDLREAFGDNEQAYFAHFLSSGMAEGRQAKLDFSLHEFIRQHPTLKGKFGNDIKAYYHEILTNPEYAEDLGLPYIGINVEPGEPMELLHKAQKISLLLLKEIDRVCKKYHLRYYLICGTLLGAIRHKSFVPWDDDADIAMPRKDFEVLKNVASSEWDGKEFLMVDYNQLGKDTFLDFMSRLMYMKEELPTNTFNKIHGKGRSDIENHIPLDIYILDNAFSQEKAHYYHTLLLQGIYGLAMAHRAVLDYSEYEQASRSIQRKVKLLTSLGRILPLRFIFWLYELVRKINNRKGTDSYIMSNGFIFCLPWKFEKRWFGKGTECTIDGTVLVAPDDWDAYLKRQYGEYMRLPAMEYRKPTHASGASGVYYTVDYTKANEEI